MHEFKSVISKLPKSYESSYFISNESTSLKSVPVSAWDYSLNQFKHSQMRFCQIPFSRRRFSAAGSKLLSLFQSNPCLWSMHARYYGSEFELLLSVALRWHCVLWHVVHSQHERNVVIKQLWLGRCRYVVVRRRSEPMHRPARTLCSFQREYLAELYLRWIQTEHQLSQSA